MPLYALGSNGSGQLGVGHTHDLSAPELVKGSHSWTVKQVAAGGNHTVLLCSDGQVRAAGNNEDSRACICGRSTYAFLEMPLWEYVNGSTLEVKQVACSWSATYLLMADGIVMVCGTGSSGEMALGEGVVGSRVLRRIVSFPPEGQTAVSISASMGHAVVVLSDGSVYGWGKGRKGQLGEPAENVWLPRKIDDIPFMATEAACGKDFTIIVGDRSAGEMKILGPDRGDRFGVKSSVPSILSNVRSLTASWGSVYAVSEDGSIHSWGRNDHGQLPPRDLPKVVALAAGSEHVLALANSGDVSAWGWGEHGNCGRHTDDKGNVRARWNGIPVPSRATAVFAGCATSFVQVAD